MTKHLKSFKIKTILNTFTIGIMYYLICGNYPAFLEMLMKRQIKPMDYLQVH